MPILLLIAVLLTSCVSSRRNAAPEPERTFPEVARQAPVVAAPQPGAAPTHAVEAAAHPQTVRGPDTGKPERVLIDTPAWLAQALAQPTKPPLTPAPCADAVAVSGVPALAAADRSIYLCCDQNDRNNKAGSEFGVGCLLYQSCAYYVSSATGWVRAHTRQELAAALGPARGPAQALGRVALVEHRELLMSGQRPSDASGPALHVETAQVASAADGFDVQLAVSPSCGCDHPVELQHYHVDGGGLVTSGAVTTLLEDRGPQLCVD